MKVIKTIFYTLAALFGGILIWHIILPPSLGWLTIPQLLTTGMFAFAFFAGSCFSSIEDDNLL